MITEHIAPYDNAHKPRLYRFYEMIPGIAVWGTLVLAIALSFKGISKVMLGPMRSSTSRSCVVVLLFPMLSLAKMVRE